MVVTFEGQDIEAFIDAKIRQFEKSISPSSPDLYGEVQYFYKGQEIESLEDLEIVYMCVSPAIEE